MKPEDFENPYIGNGSNDELDTLSIHDTRKPKLFLKDFNRLRKMREIRRYDEIMQKEFLPIMYGIGGEENSPSGF